jgi:tRNA 2-thiouridine synthesizing protein A
VSRPQPSRNQPRPQPPEAGQSGVRRSTLGRGAPPSPAIGQPVPAPTLTLDALGKKCPIPIIMLSERIGEVRVGQTVEVLADDPAAKTDLPAWCALKSQEFISASALPAGWAFLVRRSY